MCILSKVDVECIKKALDDIGETFYGVQYTAYGEYFVCVPASGVIRGKTIDGLCVNIMDYPNKEKQRRIKDLKKQLEELENE